MSRVIRFSLVLVLILQSYLVSQTEAISKELRKTLIGPSGESVEVRLRKEFVYGLTLFDGGQYQSTFCPQVVDTIYMLANVSNVITPRMTRVYFWPITSEYKADWSLLNVIYKGTLEIIRGKEVIRIYHLQDYVLYYPDGYASGAKRILIGKTAEDAVKEHKTKVDAFYKCMLQYYNNLEQYEKLKEDYLRNPQAFKEQPHEPVEPVPPTEYVTELKKGFIVKLPPGQYYIQLRSEKGGLIPNSKKKLIVFSIKARAIGYDLIPKEKWTFPAVINDPNDSLFTVEKHVFYVKPFVTVLLDTHHYVKLTRLHMPSSGRGLQNQKTWVKVGSLSQNTFYLELEKDKKIIVKVDEKPYYVKQYPGSTLGYEILEFSPKKFTNAQPSFTGFKITIPDKPGKYSFHLVDKNGHILIGSQRNFYIVRRPKLIILISIALLPLIIGIIIIGSHFFKYHRHFKSTND